jgi:predicted dehydrogenase
VVSARAAERTDRPGVDEWVQAGLVFPSGASGRTFTDMAGPDVVMELTVVGSVGRVTAANFVLPHTDDRVEVTTDAGTRTEHLGTRPSYDFQLDAVARAIDDDVPPPLDVDDAVATMDLVDAAYAAAGFAPRPSSLA